MIVFKQIAMDENSHNKCWHWFWLLFSSFNPPKLSPKRTLKIVPQINTSRCSERHSCQANSTRFQCRWRTRSPSKTKTPIQNSIDCHEKSTTLPCQSTSPPCHAFLLSQQRTHQVAKLHRNIVPPCLDTVFTRLRADVDAWERSLGGFHEEVDCVQARCSSLESRVCEA